MNMSHCRFRNTETALEECLEALVSRTTESEVERNAAQRMMITFLGFCENEGIIDGFDIAQVEKVASYSYIEEQEDESE